MKNAKILDHFFNNYYDYDQHKGRAYIGLLIYCLFQRDFLFFTLDIDEHQNNLLFKVNVAYEPEDGKEEKHPIKYINENNEITVGLCYQIPEEKIADWTEVIDFFKKQFLASTEKNYEGSLLYNILIEKKESPIYEEQLKLFNWTKELLDYGNKDNSSDLRTIFRGFVDKINKSKSRLRYNFDKLFILKDLLKVPNNSTIFNPFASAALYACYLDNEEKYVGYTHSKMSYFLGKLFLLTQDYIKDYEWHLFDSNIDDQRTYDYYPKVI